MENTIHKMITERDAGAGKPRHLPNPLRPVLAPVRLSDMEIPMETKRCTKCGEIKSVELFSKRKERKSGLRSSCNECQALSTGNWRSKNRDRAREYDRKRRELNPDKVRISSRKSYQKHRDERLLWQAAYREKFPEKCKARMAVIIKIRKGTITRQPCEICGKPNAEAHHPDYSKPLEIKWLCSLHHKQIHVSIKAEETCQKNTG